MSLQASIIAFVVVVCLTLLGLNAMRAWGERARAIGESRQDTSNLARSLAQHAEDTIRTADAVLIGLVERLEIDGSGEASLARLRPLLIEQVTSLPMLKGLTVVDETGLGLLSSVSTLQQYSFTDRDYFDFHRTHPDHGPHLGVPIRSRATGEWLIPVTRRFNHPDGSFAGIMVASLNIEFFQQFYATFDVGANSAILFALDPGTVITRLPLDGATIGQNMSDAVLFRDSVQKAPIGSFDTTSQFDGIARLNSYQHLASYPAVISVAQSRDEVLRDWRINTRNNLAAFAVLTVFFAFLGSRLTAQIRKGRKAEQKITALVADYRLLADHSTDIVARLDLSGTRRYLSPATREILGFTPEELLGTGPLDAGELENMPGTIHPDDRAHVAEFLALLRAGKIDRATRTYRMCHKSGHWVWLEVMFRLVRDPTSNEPIELVTTGRDISDRRAVEEQVNAAHARMEDAIEAIPDAFILWDADNRLVMCNSRYREFYAVSERFLVPGVLRDQFLRQAAAAGQWGEIAETEAWIAATERRMASEGDNFTRQLSDGRWLMGGNHRTRDGGWVGVRRDITASKEREIQLQDAYNIVQRQTIDLTKLADELATAKEAAESASRTKSEFLANMSHEIRTPMNGVIGMNNLLLRTQLDADQKKFANAIQLSAAVLLRLIDDILDVSKLEAGKMELEAIDFSLRSVVEDAVELLGPRARQKKIELASYVDPIARQALWGDPVRIRQILLNLLSNAIKFTDEGFVALQISGQSTATGAITLRIEVQDTGIGVDTAVLPHLFQKFQQADGSITRRFGGSGLGLAICKELLELMGGTIGVDSETGRGSLFWIDLTLPRGTKQVALRDIKNSVLLDRRVLIVDDLGVNRSILKRLLTAEGMAVETVDSGASAIVAIDRANDAGTPFELCLLDHVMPEMTGPELAVALREKWADRTPRLVLLSSIDLPGQANSDQVGPGHAAFDACLAKPVKHADLIERLQQILSDKPADKPIDKPIESRAQSAPPPPRARSRAIGPSVGGKRILVADDNEINRLLATTLLEAAGYEAASAADGLQAIEAARTGDFSLILMDVQMPNADGVQATKAIRGLPGDRGLIPIIALTANAMAGDRELYLRAGMNDYLSKPLDPDLLLRTVAGWIEVDGSPIATATSAPPAAPAVPLIDEVALGGLQKIIPTDKFQEIVGAYLDGARIFLTDIETGATAHDFVSVQHLAHDLKGTSGNLGARRLQELAGELEAACKAGDRATALNLLPELRNVATETWASMRGWLPADATGRRVVRSVK